jgi:uncharacterized RDD family membrane protein YckC
MIAERELRICIDTPEGVVFSYPLAGPMTRFLAWAIDAAVIATASSAIGKAIEELGLASAGWAVAFATIGYFVISTGYGMFFEWRWRGQTIGKRVLQLRVMDAEGLRLTVQQVAIRNLLRPVDLLPLFYLVGGAAMVISRRAQRLGDLAANTIVVRQARRDLQIPENIRSGKYNSFAAWPHLVARLRQKAPTELIEIAVSALERREQFEPASRVELFRELADRFRTLVAFPDVAGAYLTDEQYVRGLVDELTRVRGRSRG